MSRKVITLILVVSMFTVLRCGSVDEEPSELHFIVTFKDAKGLRPGQFLVYKGVRVGEVTTVDLEGAGIKVSLTADETHRTQLYKEAKFTIETLSLINPTGEHQVVMSDWGSVRTAIEEGAVIEGSDGWLSAVKDSLEGVANSAATSAAQMMGSGERPADQTPPPSTGSTSAD